MDKVIIGICDDQKYIIDILEEHINSVMKEICEKDCSILGYISPIELLRNIESIDILFLDIEMPEMDGIELGRKVRERNPQCKLIMATSRTDRFKEAFHINAFRFITKPFYKPEIMEALTSCFKNQIGENEVEVFLNRRAIKVKECEIKYVKAYNGYVEIIVGNVEYRKEISLNELEEQFDKRIFFRINRQVIVNCRYIDKYDKKTVVIDGKEFNISLRKQTDFLEKYMEYDLKYR